MSPTKVLAVLLMLSAAAFYFGRRRAFSIAGEAGGVRHLHSRPTYYGVLTALWCVIPALLMFAFWLGFEDKIITNLVIADLPDAIRSLPENRLNLVVNDIRNLVTGNIVAGAVDATMQAAAEHYRTLQSISNAALAVVTLSLGIVGALVVRSRISQTLRARNFVEQIIKYILIACSCIAILTTIGIVLSV
ncbi:MAG: phosphate ABC transporter permease family protein, partial [Syntrophobacteria bacterium]